MACVLDHLFDHSSVFEPDQRYSRFQCRKMCNAIDAGAEVEDSLGVRERLEELARWLPEHRVVDVSDRRSRPGSYLRLGERARQSLQPSRAVLARRVEKKIHAADSAREASSRSIRSAPS